HGDVREGARASARAAALTRPGPARRGRPAGLNWLDKEASMSLPRRQFLSLLASTPALAMSPSRAADTVNAPDDMPHVPWSRHAAIYQVNVRQYTTGGTFKAAMAELPRLRGMGVDILWLMPIQPIGQLNRKGTLGSYYSIRDYTAVNPEFGTLADA